MSWYIVIGFLVISPSPTFTKSITKLRWEESISILPSFNQDCSPNIYQGVFVVYTFHLPEPSLFQSKPPCRNLSVWPADMSVTWVWPWGVCALSAAEKVSSLGKDWHKFCLKCERCNKTLTPGGHAEVRPGCPSRSGGPHLRTFIFLMYYLS